MNNRFRIFCTKLFLSLILNNPFCTNKIRRWALCLCGAKIGKNTFIGQNVYFDVLAIQNIEVGDNCFITQNCSILTHFFNSEKRSFHFGQVKIGNNVFLGMNSIICKPITIGDNCIVGGGQCDNKKYS